MQIRWPLPLALAAVLVMVSAVLAFREYRGDGVAHWNDGTVHGPWRSVFNGHGSTGLRGDTIVMRPMGPNGAADTHAGLVVSTSSRADLDYRITLRTTEQLRQPVANPWEVAWIVWAYADEEHFYYLTLKPNGWELGKRDPAYPGGQRFLSTGEKPFPVGQAYNVAVQQKGATMSVAVDTAGLVTFTDEERPYLTGSVGMYTEDAAVEFSDIKLSGGG